MTIFYSKENIWKEKLDVMISKKNSKTVPMIKKKK